ncbi:MAG: hypothetical protein IPL61_38650 [Myxococcales bacterium]|nr:hypothetical protein [Myxococcales bacterium]
MQATSARSSGELLDAVQTLARLEAFASDDYAAQLAAELASHDVSDAGLAARDAALAAALIAIDGFTGKAMRIRLEHALADDTALGASFRANLAATVVGFADDLVRLGHRVAQATVRTAPDRAGAVADAVVAQAEAALAQRAALRGTVAALARSLAAAALPVARAAAADRGLDDSARARWSGVRQELAAVVAAPLRIASAPWAARVAGHEAVDERAPVIEPTFGELIELD